MFQTVLKFIETDTKWAPFADSIFKCIFSNEDRCISIQTFLKFVPVGPVSVGSDNGLALNISLYDIPKYSQRDGLGWKKGI